MLDGMFGNLGVLPDAGDINTAPLIPLLVFETAETTSAKGSAVDREQGVSVPTQTGVVDLLVQKMNDVGKVLSQVESEFYRFRDGYDLELQRYIAQVRLSRGNDARSTAELEASFGPVWLSRHLEVSSKMAKATKDYFDAHRELVAAKRVKKLAAPNDALRPDEGPFIDLTMVNKGTDRDDVTTFGDILPGRQRKSVKGWLMSEHPVPENILAEPDIVDFLDVKSSDSRASRHSLAQGWGRHVIDDYEQYVGRGQVAESASQVIASNTDDDDLAELMKQAKNVIHVSLACNQVRKMMRNGVWGRDACES